MKAPIIIPTNNRPEYLSRTLDGITRNPTFKDHPLIIGQDGFNSAVYNICDCYSTHYNNVYHIQHFREPLHTLGFIHKNFNEAAASFNFYFLLDTAFKAFPDCKSVIVLEEDMWPSPDLILYAEWVEDKVLSNPSIGFVLCQPEEPVKHFNKSIQENLYSLSIKKVWSSRGWILSRTVWEKLVKDSWTLFGDYDVHLIHRVIPYFPYYVAEPVICRTKHIGRKGVNYNVKDGDVFREEYVVTPIVPMTDLTKPVNWIGNFSDE